MKLSGNTILITGGSSGFGLEFARRFVSAGNKVIITGRDPGRLEEAARRLPGIHLFQNDIAQADSVSELYRDIARQFPTLNLLINNAGVMRRIVLQEPGLDQEDLMSELEINLKGSIRMTQVFLPLLKNQLEAAILNVSSGLALFPFPISPIYGASKAGLHSYTQSLRIQLKGTRVKVFELVAPAARTSLGKVFEGTDGYDEKMAMDPGKVVSAALKGIAQNKEEIYPGPARLMRLMSRWAPSLLIGQTGKVGAKAMSAFNFSQQQTTL